jgi:hypothetical protein
MKSAYQAVVGMIFSGKPQHCGETSLYLTMFTTNPLCTNMGLNLGLFSEGLTA